MTALDAPPFFVVGCARSGTTLLRMMLNAHPDVAVPPESHFLVSLAPGDPEAPFPIARILTHPRVASWGLEEERLLAAERDDGPWAYPQAARAVFGAYAANQGKARWGDKTPGYVEHLPLLGGLFPDARFVHVIRDGREVAASLAEWPWGPASAVGGGFWWRRKTDRGRQAGAELGERYYELRLEDLIADPGAALKALCRFLGLAFDPGMLDYMGAAQELMTQPAETWLAFTHPHLREPPTPNLRDWRAGLTTRRQRAVVAACGPLLPALGYDTDPVSWLDVARAWALRVVDASRTLKRDVMARRAGQRDV